MNHRTPLGEALDTDGRRQSWLAGHLEVSPTLVSFWCSGERTVPDKYHSPIARLLKRKRTDLFPVDVRCSPTSKQEAEAA